MITFPNAKINIGLNILRKREDGFHDIESLFYPIGLSDVLEVVKSNEFEFSSTGLDIPGNSDSNLCVKAFRLIQQDYEIGNVKLHLHKVIPMGAGLGGGSADGAFCINLLNDLFELNISLENRLKHATQLGSDCAFFIENKPVIATGRGDVLTSTTLDLSGKWIALVNPSIHIGTIDAYREVAIRKPKSDLKKQIAKGLNTWEENIFNAFEKSVFQKYSKIEEVKNNLYQLGAEYASMTGSGSTVYGIFEEEPRLNFNSFFTWKAKV
ncbi:MAG: 4-(cytidine 5'-diphospho)-2-C-methyl-D-erythritol kinase [Flavobacteriales bacterium]|nr:4-(cytidine 5'-diphospho)-2-C-methyl-D-erythritol kinase [Flavobacteriales bacterium]